MPNPNWRPGVSGNPAGRPPKSRALTAILERAGGKKITKADGDEIVCKRLVAELAWEVITTGRATFPDGTVLQASPKDWLETVRWVYQHIDGAPKQSMEVWTPKGEALRVEHGISDQIIGDEEASRLAHALLKRLAGDASGTGVPPEPGAMDTSESPDDA